MKPKTMENQSTTETSKKRKRKDPLDEMMNDMIRWEYNRRFGERSLVEILREKYIIKRK